MRHRVHWWLLVVLGTEVAVAEWLRHPSTLWVGAIWCAVLAGIWALKPMERRRSWLSMLGRALVIIVQRRRLRAIDHDWPALRESLASALAVLSLLSLALWVTSEHRQLGAIDGNWPALRETLVETAFRSLKGELETAQRRTEEAVAAASVAAADSLGPAFHHLARAIPQDVADLGVAILEPSGAPFAWAGRFRLAPHPEGDSLQVRSNSFYIVLETRRHVAGKRIAVASLLLWAAPSAPDRMGSLAERFHQKTGVNLIIYPPGRAPSGPDVFDYGFQTATDTLQLFAAQPLPPEQGASKEAAIADAGLEVTVMLLLVIVVSLLVERGAIGRLLIVGSLLWVFIRAPAGEFLGLRTWFSSATFFRTLLGPLSTSAGVLAMTSGLVTLGAITLWRKRLPVRWYTAIPAVAVLLVAPYVLRELGRGITPPSGGVSLGLWLIWQVTLLLAATAPIAVAAALLRGTKVVTGTPAAIWIGATLAVAATVAGVFVWGPRIGWPPWYTFFWSPALLLITRPAPRWSAIAGIAVVAGCAAALITWGAVIEGKLNVARKDVGSLGAEPDPLAIRQLELFGQQVRRGPPPTTASELYALWHGSGLGKEEYPTDLGLWSEAGEPRVELRLDSLDVGPALISTMVRNLDSTQVDTTVQLARTPGVLSLLLQRVYPGTVLSVVIGPRSRLIVPTRLGRLLHHQPEDAPLYSLNLSLPAPDTKVDSLRLRWRRDGWRVRGERLIAFPDGVRHIHAEVHLRGPLPIFVRGTLVVLLDIGLLTALWILAETLAGHRIRGWSWRRIRRSYQARLALTLGFFFVIPAAGFAAWGFFRLGAEDDRIRNSVITQTLRDAVLSAGAAGENPGERTDEGLLQLSRRIDAELGLYAGGAMTGSSEPVLEDLGLIPPLMPPAAFLNLTVNDELEMTADGPLAEPPVRMGYRVVLPAPAAQIGILATAQPAADPLLGEEQADLILVLLLATLIGAGGALAGAQAASRALSRPVADLRRSALALGEGRAIAAPAQAPPVEFEEVFGAFGRMAADIRSSQLALEEARGRTAAVLATVATGVIALDPQGRVLIANRRAEEILGISLTESDLLENRLGSEWAPLVEAVSDEFTRRPGRPESREVDVRGRRIRLQLAQLESGLTGVVVALNDLTDVSRAERVLAWGEMARQVAHEIKNPLTPLRLGVQHLLRIYRHRVGDRDQTLEDTATRILGEIDRLDTIARAFSRFGAPAESAALERIDLTATALEVIQLYRLAEQGATVSLRSTRPVFSVARKDEVKEVLVNLLENARNAGAGRIVVEVAAGQLIVEDDGDGISAELLPRIFEPRFSTTTSGSGLGLSIVRRLVESWGGKIAVTSTPERGTRVVIALPDES